MGCTASNDAKNLHDLEELREYIRQQELKATEQQNLLRFKIEVLVNMLAVEEKRSELTNKRLDTLKWLIHSQGVTEEAITKILNNLEKDGKISLDSSLTFTNQFQNTLQLMDLSGAIDRMREDFRNYRDDLLHCYALSNGRLMSSLPTKDFIEQTYNVTEKVSKADLKILAMRFDDGFGEVCIPEFLEYFAIPPEARNAKIAERAVKMSLDLFSLDVELLEEDPEESVTQSSHLMGGGGDLSTSMDLRKSILKDDHLLFDAVQGPEMRKSHFTRSLDRGAKRLLIMWIYVREDLEKTFLFYQKAEMILAPDITEEGKTKDDREEVEEGKHPSSGSRFSKKRFAGKEGIAMKEGKVDDSLLFEDEKDHLNNHDEEEIITVDLFRRSLEEICGPFSMILEKEANDGIIQLTASSKLSKPAILQNPTDNHSNHNSKPSSQNTSIKSTTNPRTTTTGSGGGKENHSPNQSASLSTLKNNNNKSNAGSNNKPPLDQKSVSSSTSQQPAIPEIHPLDEEDIQFLVDRFEISGFVHYRYFLRFFNDLYDRWMKYSKKFIHLPDDWMDVTPFRLSSEWNALKQTSSLRQSYQQTHDRSAQSIQRSKDRLSQTTPPPSTGAQNKAFTAPKKVPSTQNVPAETSKKPLEPKEKPAEEKKDPKVEENEKLKAEEKEPEKDSKDNKEGKESDAKPEEKKAAPVVDPPKGLLCCGAAAAKPSPNQPIDLSADKKDGDAKGAGKKSDKDLDDSNHGKRDLKIETDDLAEGKGEDDSLKLKRNESFDTPKNIKRKPVPKFDRYEGGGNHGTIEREGLGHGDAEPEIKDRTRKGRFRRRADRDFDQEKPELDDDDEK